MAPRIAVVAAALTLASLLPPVLSYIYYPAYVESVAANATPHHAHPLEAGVSLAKSARGHAIVEGRPIGAIKGHGVLLDAGSYTVTVYFTGCWASHSGEALPAGDVAALAAASSRLRASGLLVETPEGPVLLAEEAWVDGQRLVRMHCHGIHGAHGHGGGPRR